MVVSILLLLLCSVSEAAHLNVFLFAGQSNMQGADSIADGLCTASRCAAGEGVLDLNGLGTQTASDLAALFTLDTFTGGPSYGVGDIRGHNTTTFGQATNLGGAAVKGYGPEVGFSRTLYAAGIRNIAILKYTANFAALEAGVSPWVSPGTRWASWQTSITTRLAELVALGHTYTICGVVWHQGIDDGLLGRSQVAYSADLVQIMTDMRTAYGATLPFIIARSINSQAVGSTGMSPIRAGQIAVANADAKSGWVNFDDATLVNTHHMTAASQLTGGNRFGALMLTRTPPFFMPKAPITGSVILRGDTTLSPN